MKREDVIRNLLSTYKKYGITRKMIEKEIESGLQQGFSYRTIYTGLRMALGKACGEEEYFTSEDVAEALGVTVEEVCQEIDRLRAQAILRGEDPDKYARVVSPEEQQRFLIPPGMLN